MFVIQDMQLLESHPKYVNYQPGTLAKGITAATVERPLVHLDFDLIIKVNLEDLQDQTKFVNVVKDLGFKLFTFPFCGGMLEKRKGKFKSEVLFYESLEQFQKAFITISPYSFVIEDATEEMEQFMKETPEKDPLDILLDCLCREKTQYETKERIKRDGTVIVEPNKDKKLPKEYKPLYIPLAVGYIGLEEPFRTPMSRYGHPHLIAESLIGLGRAWSVGSYRKQEELKVWWGYEADTDNNLYLLKGAY